MGGEDAHKKRRTTMWGKGREQCAPVGERGSGKRDRDGEHGCWEPCRQPCQRPCAVANLLVDGACRRVLERISSNYTRHLS